MIILRDKSLDLNLTLYIVSIDDEGRQHIHHTSQDAKVLSLCDFQPDKVANVLPDSRLAAQALKDAALVLIGSGWQHSEEERDQR